MYNLFNPSWGIYYRIALYTNKIYKRRLFISLVKVMIVMGTLNPGEYRLVVTVSTSENLTENPTKLYAPFEVK